MNDLERKLSYWSNLIGRRLDEDKTRVQKRKKTEKPRIKLHIQYLTCFHIS